ncbi:flagellar filament capping protein FliD [Photobacterium leiognathi]|nr:flagellar filament capping protein FliD [Photobacterium leiognathi]
MNFELAKNGSSLSEIGIKTDEDGFLSLDRKKLEEAVKANPKAINDIFLNKHKSTSHAITVSEIGNTKTGGYFTQNGKYSVEILEKAAPAKLKSEAIAYPVEVNESNNTVKLTVNGIKMDIVLTPGKTYNSSELSLEISNQINRHDKLKAKDDSVIVNTNADGSLEFTSSKNGSKYTFEVNEDNARLGLKATTEKVRGKDVIGNINGVKALGEGDTLTLMFDKTSKGLVLTVDGSAQIGKVETVSIQRGYLNSLKNSMGHMINNEKGAIKSAIKEHEKSNRS